MRRVAMRVSPGKTFQVPLTPPIYLVEEGGERCSGNGPRKKDCTATSKEKKGGRKHFHQAKSPTQEKSRKGDELPKVEKEKLSVTKRTSEEAKGKKR